VHYHHYTLYRGVGVRNFAWYTVFPGHAWHTFPHVRYDPHKLLNRFAMALAFRVTGQSDLCFGKHADSRFVIVCELVVFCELQNCITPRVDVGLSKFKKIWNQDITPCRLEGVHDGKRVFLLGLHMVKVRPPEALYQVPLYTCSSDQLRTFMHSSVLVGF
jgi:hypothetical protein